MPFDCSCTSSSSGMFLFLPDSSRFSATPFCLPLCLPFLLILVEPHSGHCIMLTLISYPHYATPKISIEAVSPTESTA